MYVLGDHFRKSFGEIADQIYFSDFGQSFESTEWSNKIVSVSVVI